MSAGPALSAPIDPKAPPPAAVVLVKLRPDDTLGISRTAARSATPREVVARAAASPGRWVWATASTPERAHALYAQAQRAGLSAEVAATDVRSPSFLPAILFAGATQWIATLSPPPTWAYAVVAALGLTAILSIIRAIRRIGPARRAARGVGAWEAWRRTGRTEGPEAALLALEAAAAPGAHRDIDAAWLERLAVEELPEGKPRERGLREVERTVGRLGAG